MLDKRAADPVQDQRILDACEGVKRAHSILGKHVRLLTVNTEALDDMRAAATAVESSRVIDCSPGKLDPAMFDRATAESSRIEAACEKVALAHGQ